MELYATDLWKFLKERTEQSLGICERLELARKFSEKFEEIKAKKCSHRDLKPQNVLINLTSDREWNREMEITDFGIAHFGSGDLVIAGTSGWAEGYQFVDDAGEDEFAARLMIFMILLSWNR